MGIIKYTLMEISHFVKEKYFAIKYYNFKRVNERKRPYMISMVDGKFSQGGLCDRFKGIISLYAYCKYNNLVFKLWYVSPFDLNSYLLPNTYDWSLCKEDISNNIFDSRFLYNIAEFKGRRLFNLRTNKQVHYYGNRDLVDILNKQKGINYKWGELFKELFRPAKGLEEELLLLRKGIGKDYMAATFRFQQLLGDFQDCSLTVLDEENRQKLMEKCAYVIKNIIDRINIPLLITSDSITFINYVSNIKGVYIIPGKIIHTDYAKGEDYEIHLKTFLDFFMLSESKKIMSIGTKEMYESEFPLYAAKINDIPFERILI